VSASPEATPMTGLFDDNGSPTVEIEVSGPVHEPRKMTAMVDTGFSGFLLLPILEAFPVGLILSGTTSIELADGSKQNKLTCLGEIHFGGMKKVGLIIIEWENTDILVGMDFLRKFEKTLIVDPVNKKVILFPASMFTKSKPPSEPEPPTSEPTPTT
jgi:predicted aspartyl protease